jgi:ABC-2 type transport system ATP-binding protein
MTYFENRLQEVAGYFAAGDAHLGYRRLLDAAIETANFEVYEETLRFCDWYDTQTDTNKSTGELSASVNALLQLMAKGYKGNEQQATGVLLSAKEVSKKYAHGRFSLSATNVTLNPAQIIGLVGENGNGKTTLLRLLHGELQPDSGSIDYHLSTGEKGRGLYDTKAALGFIPQRPQQWYGGLMENLHFASTFTGYTGKENHLWTEIMVARMGLRPFRGYSWSRISSGYKMRFELARTLIRKPNILLLDEPLANLDMLAQQIILEDLRYLAQSHSSPLSILLSSQQLYEVEKVSDQVIFLQKGVPKYQSTVSETEIATGLTIELETTASREVLQTLFASQGLQKLSFNGGVYIMYFEGAISFAAVLKQLGEADLLLKYIRDISASSRRFFDA